MKISIITATYNSEKTVASCIKSVLNQDYSDIEHIIVDGQSNDLTLDIIKKVSQNHQSIRLYSEPDKGIYDALNKGIHFATGDVIGFVHSDDVLASDDVISKIVDQFKVDKCDGVYGNLNYVGMTNPNKIIRTWKSSPFQYKSLRRGWMPPHPTLYLKRDIYEKFGGFDLDFKIAADYDFILRIFKQKDYKFSYLNALIVNMKIGGASNRNIRNIMLKTREDFKAVKKNEIGNFMIIVLKNLSKVNQFWT